MAGRGLDSLIKQHVAFDPTNPEHRRAYHLIFTTGKQHPTLRFQLEEPFHSVLLMMQSKLARHAVREFDIIPNRLTVTTLKHRS